MASKQSPGALAHTPTLSENVHKPKSSGCACNRAYFKGDFLKEDPLCREFVEKECINIWIGHDVHLVQNMLRDGDKPKYTENCGSSECASASSMGRTALKKLEAGQRLDPEDVMMRNRWLYPFDAEADTLQRWKEVAALVDKELEEGQITPLFTTAASDAT
ncbi:uncharacterized protein BDV17DRAFT_291851 [Aspergillus undulatus]|uniref:uncharacterized protein n=1 Tax=Aspergillus undulatus TaxID=1810928 RepID=UPI003CCDAD05